MMGREIKFRCFDGGEMVDVDRIQFDGSGVHAFVLDEIARECGGEIHYDLKWVPLTLPLMQYTGLKDRDGKELYEGDIIDVPYNRIGYQEVKWDTKGWSVARFDLTVCVLVGNIHEHPKLLKSRKP